MSKREEGNLVKPKVKDLPGLKKLLAEKSEEFYALREVVDDLEAHAKRPIQRKKVGRFFMYGSRDSNGESWPIFIKVVGLRNTTYDEFDVLTYEKTPYSIEINYKHVGEWFLQTEISEVEFKKGVAPILKEMRAVDKGVFSV